LDSASKGVKSMDEPLDLSQDTQSDSEWLLCPYCGEAEGDGWEWVTDYIKENTCSNCDKTYQVWRDVSVVYYTRKIKTSDAC